MPQSKWSSRLGRYGRWSSLGQACKDGVSQWRNWSRFHVTLVAVLGASAVVLSIGLIRSNNSVALHDEDIFPDLKPVPATDAEEFAPAGTATQLMFPSPSTTSGPVLPAMHTAADAASTGVATANYEHAADAAPQGVTPVNYRSSATPEQPVWFTGQIEELD